MNSRTVVRRLQAFRAGRPLPLGERISMRIADPDDVLIVAFVRMGGESRPWGIAMGHPNADPEILTVPEGRDRDLVAEMAASFTPVLLSHLRSPMYVRPEATDWPELAPLQQVWLPNSSHLDMIQHLAYAYTFTTAGGELNPTLNALGRACGWLFREANRPGEQHLAVATAALRDAYTFPTEDARQGHLGYLLAWLDADGDWTARLDIASREERHSMSTTLDPSVERLSLEPSITAWREARREGSATAAHAEAIREVLVSELTRRHELTVQAWKQLRTDGRRENAQIQTLVDESLKEQWFQWFRSEIRFAQGERPFVPSVETDRDAAGAATMYSVYQASAERLATRLLHDDRELLAEALARGDALAGTIVRVADEGNGRTTVPVWWVAEETSGPMRLREGSKVCVVGLSRRTGEIRAIASDEEGRRRFEIEITNLKLAPKSADGRNEIAPSNAGWIGERIEFATAASDLSIRRNQKLWNRDVPGAWLTHARPAPEASRTEDLDLDRVG